MIRYFRSTFLPFTACSLALAAAGPASAQSAGEAVQSTSTGTAAQPAVAPAATPLADRLMEQVRILAGNPRNLEALLIAGETSVRLSDPVAAMGFFARADQISPRNPRALAGRAAALVSMERPGEAIWLFREAEQRGMAIEPMALDRGLAFDLLGRPDLAQRDYRLILNRGDADEAVRRLALSLGISGNLAEATRLIDPLLRRNDRSAWRAWACVLAMNGDPAQAKTIAAGSLPGFGPSLAPFFDRLARLPVADRAYAVHFGTLSANADRRADLALAPDLSSANPQAGVVRLAALNLPDRPRAADMAQAIVQPLPGPRQAAAVTRPVPPPAATPGSVTPAARSAPVTLATAKPLTPGPAADAGQPSVPAVRQPASVMATASPVAAPAPAPAKPPVDLAAERAAARAELAEIVARLAGDADPTPEPVVLPERVAKPMVLDTPAAKPTALAAKPAARATETAAAEKAKPKPKSVPAKPDPKKLHPSRIWVQVGVGANPSKLPYTWRQLSRTAPEAFRGKKGGYTDAGRTNRLLVGPFASNAQANAFLTAIKKKDLDGFQWTSPAGQEIETLAVE
ncbi:SPOR domain-containing protein [Sphingomonas sp. FW199]|uniref:SPOR domain-containing protein n=1 Tax=Sphingomonas sp. FW199 TaxID=3400217 RepID=UPI003CFA03D8